MDRRPSKDFWLTAVSAWLMLALTWAAVWRIDGSERERYLQDQRAAVQSKMGGIRAELEKALNQRLHLVRGLAAFARSQLQFDHQAFDVYARELQGSQTGIMSLQLAPGGVITYIHPLAGNEGAQGHDLLRDERARGIVLEMLETREFRLAGPMPLRQGGIGLIGRMPVYTSTADGAAAAFRAGDRAAGHRRGTAPAMAPDAGRTGLSSPVPPPSRAAAGVDTAGEHFWGFATVLINWTDLLRDTGLAGAVADVEWALRGKDGKGAQGDVIAGDAALFGPAQLNSTQSSPDSVLATVSLPSGSWQLAGRPAGGWSVTWPGRNMLYTGATLLSALVLLVTWMQLKYRRALEQARAAEQAARWAAEAASQAKSDFLANVSHEVRTPINAVIGFTQLALRASPEPKVKSYLQKVQGSTYILLNLINDILDLSKIEANRLELERVPFNLEDVFSNIANVIALQASQKGLELAFHLDPAIPGTLIGDPLRLGQALANLVVNAVKFTEQGEVVVTAELAGPAGMAGPDAVAVRFHVRDTGIGIPADKLDKLFMPFTQADSSITRRFGGTGLGLSITRELVGRMGGQISVASEPGAGSTFSFTLCLAYGDSRRAAFCPLVEGRGLRVLVVDDNLSAREILSETLRGVARVVATAESGEEALALLGDAPAPAPFDVILLDWRMPGLDGLETGRRIAARYAGNPGNPGYTQPTLLMVSAYDGEAVRQEAENAGIRRFLTKPVNPSTLLDTVLELIGQHDLAPGADDGGVEQRMAGWQRALSGRTVMVAEDNRVNQEVLQGLLEQVGVSVVLAQHGEDALEKLYRLPVDAVLMDLQMPRLDGLQATAIIRQDAAWRRLPIIAMTAHAQASDRERCLAVGMNAHLTKPIDPEQLYRTLEEWLPAPATGDRPPLPAIGTGNSTGDRIGDSIGDRIGTAGSGPELPASLPGIDIAAALKVVAGNRANFIRIARRFTADFTGVADTLMRHAALGEWEQAGRLAHALKGAAGNSGALQVFHAAAGLERLCARIAGEGGGHSVQESGVAELVERIRAGMAEVQDSVARLEGNGHGRDGAADGNCAPPASGQAAVDGALAALLDDAAQRLGMRRLITEEQIATMRALCGAEARPALELFIQALDRFDYREAESLLAQLRSRTASCSPT